MGGDIARTVRIGVVAPYTSDGVSLFDDYEVMPPRALEANCHADAAESGTNDRDRAAGQTGGFPGGGNVNSLAKLFAIVGSATRRMLAGMAQTLNHFVFLLKGSNDMRQRCKWHQTVVAAMASAMYWSSRTKSRR